MQRKCFQIGFNKCGTTFLAKLFEVNNYPAVHWLGGALARDIAYSKLVGRPPLQKWVKDTVVFTDMESTPAFNLPMDEGYKEFEFLDRNFPGSVFLLNTRQVEDWIISRYMHLKGKYALNHARRRGVAVGDLADIWHAEWDAHLAAVRAYFNQRPEFVEIDIDRAGPDDYRDILAPWFDLPVCPALPTARTMKKRAAYLPKLDLMLNLPVPGSNATEAQKQEFASTSSRFATPSTICQRNGDSADASPTLAIFDAASGEAYDRSGEALPILRNENGDYLTNPEFRKWQMTAAVINDIAAIADHGLYRIDLSSTHLKGSQTAPNTDTPTIGTSRRIGAENLFLWPHPDLHRVESPMILGAPLRNDPEYDDKKDCAVWRGALAGYVSRAGEPDLTRPIGQELSSILRSDSGSEQFNDAVTNLQNLPRVALVNKYKGSRYVNAAFLKTQRIAQVFEKSGLPTRIATSGNLDNFLLKHKYIICLGDDSGTDGFLPMAHGRSVVLKEEDGWEMFHTALFKPWEHYIPLKQGATDLDEKLEWARANPEACKTISTEARQTCRMFANQTIRRETLKQVLESYLAATGQGG